MSSDLSPSSSCCSSSCCHASEAAESQHLLEVVSSFLRYERDALAALGESKEEATVHAISANAKFLNDIIAAAAPAFGLNYRHLQQQTLTVPTLERNASKVCSTLKQFVREWSLEGEAERAKSFSPLINALKKYLPVSDKVNIVCPGSGLGRLPYEIAKSGYNCIGNEFSYHMLLASYFVLNGSDELSDNKSVIYPYCMNMTSCRGSSYRLQPVSVPDCAPHTVSPGQMSMAAGEFEEVFGESLSGFAADGVVTCFFIDTAKNILSYIRTIARMVKPNGLWTNYGPLLYHFADQSGELSIELSWAEIRECILEYFTIVEERVDIHDPSQQSVYTANSHSLFQTVFKCIFFAALRNEAEVIGTSNPSYV